MAPPSESDTSAYTELQPALDEALHTATRSRPEKVLRSVCHLTPDALKLVEILMVDSHEPKPAAGRFNRPRYFVCVNPRCGAEVDVRENKARSCTWHDGTCDIPVIQCVMT